MASEHAPRRALFASVALAAAAGLLWLAWRTMAPGGWTAWEVLAFACFAGTAPWTALCAANALVGFVVLMGAADPPAAVLPALRRARAGAALDASAARLTACTDRASLMISRRSAFLGAASASGTPWSALCATGLPPSGSCTSMAMPNESARRLTRARPPRSVKPGARLRTTPSTGAPPSCSRPMLSARSRTSLPPPSGSASQSFTEPNWPGSPLAVASHLPSGL